MQSYHFKLLILGKEESAQLFNFSLGAKIPQFIDLQYQVLPMINNLFLVMGHLDTVPRDSNTCSLSFATFTLNSHWGSVATGKKKKKSCVYAHRVASVLSDSLQRCRLACQSSVSERGFSGQEYWSILSNTGCHTLLEHYISCCHSCQFPWVPGAARTPLAQAAAPPSHLASQGKTCFPEQPLEQPRWMTHMQKPQLKPRGSVAMEEEP